MNRHLKYCFQLYYFTKHLLNEIAPAIIARQRCDSKSSGKSLEQIEHTQPWRRRGVAKIIIFFTDAPDAVLIT